LIGYPDGEYSWSVNLTDITGLIGSSDTWKFYIDTNKPEVTLNQPNGSDIITTNNVSFNFSVIDYVDGLIDCNISIDGEVELETTVTNATNSFNYLLVSGGNHTWNVTCMDEAANFNYSNSINFTIIAPPIVTLEEPVTDNRTNQQDISFFYTPEDAMGITKCEAFQPKSTKGRVTKKLHITQTEK